MKLTVLLIVLCSCRITDESFDEELNTATIEPIEPENANLPKDCTYIRIEHLKEGLRFFESFLAWGCQPNGSKDGLCTPYHKGSTLTIPETLEILGAWCISYDMPFPVPWLFVTDYRPSV